MDEIFEAEDEFIVVLLVLLVLLLVFAEEFEVNIEATAANELLRVLLAVDIIDQARLNWEKIFVLAIIDCVCTLGRID